MASRRRDENALAIAVTILLTVAMTQPIVAQVGSGESPSPTAEPSPTRQVPGPVGLLFEVEVPPGGWRLLRNSSLLWLVGDWPSDPSIEVWWEIGYLYDCLRLGPGPDETRYPASPGLVYRLISESPALEIEEEYVASFGGIEGRGYEARQGADAGTACSRHPEGGSTWLAHTGRKGIEAGRILVPGDPGAVRFELYEFDGHEVLIEVVAADGSAETFAAAQEILDAIVVRVDPAGSSPEPMASADPAPGSGSPLDP